MPYVETPSRILSRLEVHELNSIVAYSMGQLEKFFPRVYLRELTDGNTIRYQIEDGEGFWILTPARYDSLRDIQVALDVAVNMLLTKKVARPK